MTFPRAVVLTVVVIILAMAWVIKRKRLYDKPGDWNEDMQVSGDPDDILEKWPYGVIWLAIVLGLLALNLWGN